MIRHQHSLTLLQASQESPTLARLTELTADSSARLRAIDGLLPTSLKTAIKAGPIEGDVWCLIVANTAIAAKLRQILPALVAHLRTQGWDVASIRLKVQTK